ncbi:MAG: TolC family protein [Bacteroidales bacterium]|nr:TolC family protein [Bacteroidales bacterium]
MIKKTVTILSIILALAGTGSAMAQDNLRLSLEEAQQYAEQHNYTLQNASLDIRVNEAKRWQAIASMLPQISTGFDYQNMCGYELAFANTGMKIPMNPNGTFNIQAAIALTGAQIVSKGLTDIALSMSNIQQKQNVQTVRSNVKKTYTSILVMEETVSLLDSSLANMEQLMKSTQGAVDAGAVEQITADKLSVQVASLRNSLISTRRSLNVLYNSMVLLLGADVDTKITLTTSVDELMDIEKIAQIGQRQFNIEQNYDYMLLTESEKVSKKQILLAKMNATPTVSAYYQYSYKTYFGRDAGMNMTPPNVIGISISQPLFKSGSVLSQVKAAKLSYQETLNSKRQAEDGLKVQYNQLCYDLASAIDSYRTQKDNIDVSKRVFDNTLEKYKYGMATNVDVTNSSTDIITAQSNYIQAVLSVINAQVALENMMTE